MTYFNRYFLPLLKAFGLGWLRIIYSKRSYLATTGWLLSVKKGRPLDTSNNSIPWLTYPFLEFIESRLTKDMHVFEYGSGNSTKWFAERVGRVSSIEHDEGWFDLVKSSMPGNVDLRLQTFPEEMEFYERAFLPLDRPSDYAKRIDQYDQKFDLIVVDGIDRNNSMAIGEAYLSDRGVMIADNLENESHFKPSVDFMLDKGYKFLPFWGLSPCEAHKTCTGIFYKENNVLNI